MSKNLIPLAVAVLSACVASAQEVPQMEAFLGYYPKHARNDGKYRRINVRLNLPTGISGLRAQWRTGYYAPNE